MVSHLLAPLWSAGCRDSATERRERVVEVGPESGTEEVRKPVLRFGVVPQQSATKMARLWQPVLANIGARAGVTLQFATAPDIPTFERRLSAGEYDMAYMNPYHYVVFHRVAGYDVFVREKGRRIRGIIVVREDSTLERLSQLEGATLALPAPAAFAAILPLAHLREQGIDVEPAYVSTSHDSVYRAVALGLHPAGGGVERTLDNTEPEVRAELRVLLATDGYSPHAFAAHSRVDGQVRDAVARAMVEVDQSEAGRALLAGLTFRGFEMAVDSQWDDVRALDIEVLDHLIDERVMDKQATQP